MNGSSHKRMPDLLVLAQESWGPVKRRNQQLTRALAVRNPRARFVFVEQALRPRQALEWRRPRPHPVASNIWTVRPLRVVPDTLSQSVSDRMESAQISSAVRHVGLEQPMLWSQDPRAADLIDRLP